MKKNSNLYDFICKKDIYFILIVFIVFYLLYRFSPFILDDYAYSFIGGMSNGINGKFYKIESLNDIITSQIQDYMRWNGRFIIHSITSYFCSIGNIEIFRILNSIIFCFLLIGIIILLRAEYGFRKTDKYIILFSLIIITPASGQIYFAHIAYVINYLWTSCAIIYFIILLNKIKEKSYSILINILLFAIGIITGSLQESFTIGISGALFIYYCFNLKKFTGSIRWIVIGFWIGTCIVVGAPGNISRAIGNTAVLRFSGWKIFAFNFIHLILDSRLFFLCIILSIYQYIKNKTQFILFIKHNYLYYLAIIFNGITVIIVYTGLRQLACIELMSLILNLKIVYTFYPAISKYSRPINIITSSILILTFIVLYHYRQIYYQSLNSFQNKEIRNGLLVDKEFLKLEQYLSTKPFISDYTAYTSFRAKYNWGGLSRYRSDGKNINLITGVSPLNTKEIISKFGQDTISTYVYDKENKVFYLRLDKNKKVNQVISKSEPTKILGKIRQIIFKDSKYNTFISNLKDMSHFEEGIYSYYIMYSDNENIQINFK